MRVAFFIPNLKCGGAEKVILNLINEFVNRENYHIDLLLMSRCGDYLSEVHEGINIINFNKKRIGETIFDLKRYIQENDVDVLVSAITHVNIIAILSKLISRKKSLKLIITEHTIVSLALGDNNYKNSLLKVLVRMMYPFSDSIVASSNSIKVDLVREFNVADSKVQVIYNPVITSRVMELANEKIENTSIDNFEGKIIVSIGRLESVKGHSVLLNAYKLICDKCNSKLVIVGSGSEMSNLTALVEELKIKKYVEFISYTSNPYKYIKRSDIVVSTSFYEGFGNVIVEALAFNKKVVSTATSGPSEILEYGKYGTIVPIGNVDIISEELLKALQDNSDNVIRKNVQQYHVEEIVEQYIDLVKILSVHES